MELSVDSLKKVIVDNPGITHSGLKDIFDMSDSAITRYLKKVADTREVGGKESWLFKQCDEGIHKNFSRTYAKQHKLKKSIRKPTKQGDTNRDPGQNAEGNESIRMANMWKAPKRLT